MVKEANITLMVKDMNASVSFYQALGLQVKNRWGDHYAQLTAPGITIGLHPSSNVAGNSGNVSIGFSTDNFEGAASLLQSMSVQVTKRDEEGGKFMHFKDPDGTELYFIKPKW